MKGGKKRERESEVVEEFRWVRVCVSRAASIDGGQTFLYPCPSFAPLPPLLSRHAPEQTKDALSEALVMPSNETYTEGGGTGGVILAALVLAN